MFFLTFFSKESIIINIERNLCFVLQTKNSVKKINSANTNVNFFIRKKFFRHGFNLAQRQKTKFGEFCHFTLLAPNFLRAKTYPNKVFSFLKTVFTNHFQFTVSLPLKIVKYRAFLKKTVY